MKDILHRVVTLIHQAASQYPGGIVSIAAVMSSEDGRASSTMYKALSDQPYKAPDGKMKDPNPRVGDLIRVMELTGNINPLHAINAHFGLCASGLACNPDAATVEAEMLQDYPALVDFHKAVQAFRAGDICAEELLAAQATATREIQETLTKVIDGCRGASA